MPSSALGREASVAKRSSMLIVGSILGLMVSVSTIYMATFSVFLPHLSREFGWSRGAISAGFAVAVLSVTLLSPFIGRLIGHYSIRRVLAFSIPVFSLGIMLMARLPDSWAVFMAVSVLIGIGGAATNTFVYVSILPQWFSDRLGLALGLAMTGIGIGQTIMPLLSQTLIAELGWRNAYLVLAVIPLVIALPSVAWLLKEKQKINDSSSSNMLAPDKKAAGGILSLHPAVKTAHFWRLSLCFFSVAVIAGGCSVHGIAILLDRGFNAVEAAEIVALSGISVFVGRIVSGLLLDYIGALPVGIFVLLGAAFGALILSGYLPVEWMVIGPALIGLALGAEGDLMPYMIRENFEPQDFSAIYGLLFMVFNFGVMTGPLALGAYYDVVNNYDAMLQAFSLLSVLIALPAFYWTVSEKWRSTTRAEN